VSLLAWNSYDCTTLKKTREKSRLRNFCTQVSEVMRTPGCRGNEKKGHTKYRPRKSKTLRAQAQEMKLENTGTDCLTS